MATQIATTGEKKLSPTNAVKAMLDTKGMQQLLAKSAGKHADSFAASIIELVSTDKALQTCEPAQICAQALKAASLQLPIQKALGCAYVVVYNNKVSDGYDSKGKEKFKFVPTPTMLIGYRGLIQLAIRSGRYKYINADVVYEGELVGKDKLTGAIDLTGEKISDKVIGYFCHFQLVDGFSQTLYMSVEDVAKHAIKFSKTCGKSSVEELIAKAGKGGKGVGWFGDFDAMALKTCTRRLLGKYGLLSVEMQNAVAEDIKADVESNVEEAEAIEIREAEIAEAVTEEIVDISTGEIKQEAPQGFSFVQD